MKEGNYLIRVRIFEASDIKPIESTGSADTFVVVEALGKRQKTQVARDTLSPLFDKSFNFEFGKLEKGLLELAKIKIELWDYNRFFANDLIGAYEIDLTTVYYQPFHQFHRSWFTLTDPKDEREGLQGYILANIEVLGPGDEPKVIEKITEDSTNKTIVSSKIKQDGHLIIAEVYRAEHIVPMNITTKKNRLIVNMNYGGVSQSTIDPKEELNPSFNQVIYLQAMLPNHSKNVQIEVYDKSTIVKDTLIGTGLVPFNTFKYLDDLPPTWINIYGPPLTGVGKKAEEMARFGAKRGSCYRGRILVRMSSRDHDNPVSRTVKMTFKPPEIIVPTPPSKTYTLRVDCYSGQELPGTEGMLHFVLGPYLLKTKIMKSVAGKIGWDVTLEKTRLILPLDVTMIPDLIVYFADKDFESHRKCFYRVKALKILARSKRRYEKSRENPQIVKLREDQTLNLVEDDQFSGFVTVRPVLFACRPPQRMNFSDIRNPAKQKKYILKLFVYVARSLPSANDGGISNPFLVARCMGETMITKTKRYTLNPEWYQVMEREITIPDINDKDTPNPTLVLMCYHSDDGSNFEPTDLDKRSKRKVLLGRYWLDLDVKTKKKFKGISETIDIIYSKPKWVPIVYDKNEITEGKLMISYAVVEKEKNHIIEDALESKGITGIEPEYKNIDMTLFTIGVRNIINRIGFYKPVYCSAEIKLSRELEELQSDPTKIDKDMPLKRKSTNNPMDEGVSKISSTTNTMIGTKTSDSVSSDGVLRIGKIKVINGGISFNRSFRFRVKAPYNPKVCPVLEVFLFHYPLGRKKLLGAATFELRNVLGFHYGDEDDSDYKKRWKNFFATAEISQFNDGKVKPPKFKLPKVRPENRLLYLDDMVYKLPTNIKSKKRQKREFWKNKFGGQAVINKLDKWAHQVRNRELAASMNFMDDDLIHPDDLKQLTDGEKKKIQDMYNIIDNDDLEFGLTKQNFTRKYEANYVQEHGGFEEDFDHSAEEADLDEDVNSDGEALLKPPAKKSNMMNRSPGKVDQQDHRGTVNDVSMAKQLESIREVNEIDAQLEEEKRLVELMGDQNERDALNQAEMLERQKSVKSESVIDNFALKDFQDVSSLKADVSEKALKYDNVFVKERIESKKNKIKQKKKRKKKKAGLFGGGFSFKKGLNFLFGGDDDKIEYIDFDTDEEEEIDDVPEYLKGRMEFQDDLEDEISDKDGIIKTFKIRRGNKRDVDSYYHKQLSSYEEVATFKCLFLREDKKDLIPISKIKRFLHDMLRERKYMLRVYVLKGVGITPDSDRDDISTYVKLNLNGVAQDSSEQSQDGFFPEYYKCFEFHDVVMPGSAYLNIDIIEDTLIDSTLGSTFVDLEQRIFNLSWQKMKLKPVEKRSIESLGKGSRGRLEMWIELIPPRQAQPQIHIFPRTQLEYELRVVVWETKDCIFKDEATACNDLYVQGAPKRQISNFKMTDTHWRCRAKGSFNWRWKFKIHLPVDQNKNYGEDVFVVQLWDRDLIARNDLIGEAQIDLNIHKMLKKAHSRKSKVVTMKRRVKGSGLETKKLWFDVYHPDAVDEFDNQISQGKVCLSFEIIPEKLMEILDNAEGRSDPNFYPTLPDPVGRFTFDLFSPLKMIKELIGGKLYRRICMCCWCIVCAVIGVFVGYFLVINYIALKLAGV